ncbi:MAG: TolC family protein [Spirochaetia bacterium]|nr:TolC family protein [Spirochaetia bacterium]
MTYFYNTPNRNSGRRILFLKYIFVFVFLWQFPVLPVFSQNAPGQAAESSINFYVQKALEKNPQYLAALHDSGQTKSMYESESMFMQNPMLSFALVNVPLATFPSLTSDPMTSMSFMLEQEISLPGESLSRKKMALNEYLAKEKDADALRLMLISKVEGACYDLVFLYQKKKLLVENRQALEGIVSVTRTLVSVNKINSAQLLKLEARLSQMANEITETEAMIIRGENELENLTTQKPEEKKLPLDRLEPESIKIPSGFKPENHPMYKASLAMRERARANKEHEVAKYFPSLKFGADYMVRQPIPGVSMSGEDMISLRITAPLPLFFAFKESKSVKAADEGLTRYDQYFEETRLRLKTSWQGEYGMAQNLLTIYSNYHRDILPRYYASYKAMLGSLSSSQVSLLDVLDSYRDYLEVSIKEAEVYRDLRKSISMLKYLGGEK